MQTPVLSPSFYNQNTHNCIEIRQYRNGVQRTFCLTSTRRTVEMFDELCVFLGDADTVPMVPFLAVVTSTESRENIKTLMNTHQQSVNKQSVNTQSVNSQSIHSQSIQSVNITVILNILV